MQLGDEADVHDFIRTGLCNKGALTGYEACICATSCHDCVVMQSAGGACSWLNPGQLSFEFNGVPIGKHIAHNITLQHRGSVNFCWYVPASA